VTAKILQQMRAEEDGHRHRLIELYRRQFGDHIPLIRRQDIKGFVERRPIWLVRPLGLNAVRKLIAEMELETKHFYVKAAEQATDAGVRQLLGDLAEEERKHQMLAAELETERRARCRGRRSGHAKATIRPAGHSARLGRSDGRFSFDAGPTLRRCLRHT
jgi:rubrerythrin